MEGLIALALIAGVVWLAWYLWSQQTTPGTPANPAQHYAPPIPIDAGATNAGAIMRGFNPNAIDSWEGGRCIFIEDVTDPDGRMFRLEYRCDPDGRAAIAYCLYNPWGNNPFSYIVSHLKEDGFLCLGDGIHQTRSPYDLNYVVPKARFWCTAYSFFREHGAEETYRVMPEWRGVA